MELTREQAKRFMLAYHNLWPPRQLRGKAGVMRYIRRVGCIQYDPLDMVGSNPNLVLQARVKGYRPQLLQELLYGDRLLVDGWDKNMSIYPVENWPYFRRYREAAYRRYADRPELKEILPAVRQAIRSRGPLSSSDLDFDTKISWSWAPTRLARATLESMYSWGELVIFERIGTRRVYDFAGNHLPSEILAQPDPHREDHQFFRWMVKRRIGALGLLWCRGGDAWLGIPGLKAAERRLAFSELEEAGEIVRVTIEGLSVPLFIPRDAQSLCAKIISSRRGYRQAAFLAPLDNLLWDRRLIKALFDFDYTWEVYKPADQRHYGYYVLPVLYGDALIARFEPRFDKKSGELRILNWWWEPGVRPSTAVREALRGCFQAFAEYLQATSIAVAEAGAGGEELKDILP